MQDYSWTKQTMNLATRNSCAGWHKSKHGLYNSRWLKMAAPMEASATLETALARFISSREAFRIETHFRHSVFWSTLPMHLNNNNTHNIFILPNSLLKVILAVGSGMMCSFIVFAMKILHRLNCLSRLA